MSFLLGFPIFRGYVKLGGVNLVNNGISYQPQLVNSRSVGSGGEVSSEPLNQLISVVTGWWFHFV